MALVSALAVAGALWWRTLRLRRDVAAQRERSATVAGGAFEAIVWCDSDARIVEWNDAAAQLFGMTLGPGIPFATVVDSDSSRPVGELLERFAETEARSVAPSQDQAVFAPNAVGGPARIEIKARRIGSAQGFALFVRDITASSALELERTRTRRADTIGQLAHGIAHDFNNLLTTISGRVDLAMQHMPPGAPGRPHLDEVRAAAARASALARRLLTLSRDEEFQPRIVPLNELVRSLEPMLHRLAGATAIVLRQQSDTGNVNADPARLQEVLLVLSQQAIDSVNGQRGRVLVSTRRIVKPLRGGADGPPSDFTVVEIAASADGSGGPAPEHAFTTTTTAGRPASELELASAYSFARQSGGTLEAESAVNRDAKIFRLNLPRVSDDANLHREGRLLSNEAPHRPTVLVVEDEESVRLFIRLVLEKQDYRVLQAGNGVEALRLLDDPSVTVDVLLTDVMMPQMGGRELAERMLEVQPDVRVVFMSGYVADRALLTGVAERRAPLLQKPFSLEEMVRVVREQIEQPA